MRMNQVFLNRGGAEAPRKKKGTTGRRGDEQENALDLLDDSLFPISPLSASRRLGGFHFFIHCESNQ
jgi:hypothetical protein